MNQGLKYIGSYKPDTVIQNKIKNSNYFTVMDNLISELYKYGYYGYVDVDSMIMLDDTIIPIIEINARKSMGLINHFLDIHLKNENLSSMLSYLNLGLCANITPEQLLHMLKSNNLLYQRDKSGILPLSMNTVFCNQGIDNKDISSGRFYFSSIAKTLDQKINQIDQLKQLSINNNIKIY